MHIILTGKAPGWYQSYFSQEEYGNDGENIYLPKIKRGTGVTSRFI